MNRRRVVAFPLVRLVAAAAVLFVWLVAFRAIARAVELRGDTLGLFVEHAVLVVGAVIALAVSARMAGRSLAASGLARRRVGRHLGVGFAGGIALAGAGIAIIAALGSYRASAGDDAAASLAIDLPLFLVGAFEEELVFRGLLFGIVEDLAGTWGALAVTSALFGAIHLANPSFSWIAMASTVIVAGGLLSSAYVATRDLWLCTGIHAGFNFTQAWLFGLPVSGLGFGGSLVTGELHGPELVSGGRYGLEASIVLLAIGVPVVIAAIVRVARRADVRPPMWRRSAELSASRPRPPA